MVLSRKKSDDSQKQSNVFVGSIIFLFILFFSPILIAANLPKNIPPEYSLKIAKTITINNDINIISKPILFDKERIELTRQYRREHYGINDESIEIQPRMIVLHWTEIKGFQDTYNIFYPAVLKNRFDISKGGDLNVSAHFLVDRDGKIYQLMPTNWMARHIIGLNNIAIGIENVGGVGSLDDLTQAQVDANIYLVRKLKQQYPNIEYLIGHYEYGSLRNTELWQEKDNNYFTDKKDPGERFMRLVRNGLKDPTECQSNL